MTAEWNMYTPRRSAAGRTSVARFSLVRGLVKNSRGFHLPEQWEFCSWHRVQVILTAGTPAGLLDVTTQSTTKTFD